MRKNFSETTKDYTKAIALSVVITAGAAGTGCATNPYTGEQEFSKAGLGSIIGAVTGALIDKDKPLRGGLLGAAAGGGTGYYFDLQADKLRQKLQGTGVSVKQQEDGSIVLNMPGDVTFKSGSADVQAQFFPVLQSVAEVLNEYNNTDVTISGYTDRDGPAASNQTLSEDRANSVEAYLNAQDVSKDRTSSIGYGETKANQQKTVSADRSTKIVINAPEHN